jgi:hypothetical protein
MAELEPEAGTTNHFTIAPPPAEHRDATLGAFMGAWSDLEATLDILLWRLMGSSFDVARIVATSGLGIAQLKELLIALGRLSLSPEAQTELEKLGERLKRLNTKRNRIVHGRWGPLVTNDRSPRGTPRATVQWIRVYAPTDPEVMRRMMRPGNQKEAAAYTFRLSTILRVAKEVTEFRIALTRFLETSCPRPPGLPPPTSSPPAH